MSDFSQYFTIWKSKYQSDNLDGIISLIRHYRNLEELNLPFSAMFYVWNMQSYEYIYFSPSVYQHLGYTDQEILTGGPGFVLNIIHPEDAASFVHINKKLSIFMRQLPTDTYHEYRLSYTLRVKRRETDTYLHLLIEEAIIRVNTLGEPILATGKISDISHLNSNRGTSLYVSKAVEGEGDSGFFLYRAQYNVLSQREQGVLTLIVEGRTNTEIAARLNISVNTVKSHRKNMMKKTGTINTAALIGHVYGAHFSESL